MKVKYGVYTHRLDCGGNYRFSIETPADAKQTALGDILNLLNPESKITCVEFERDSEAVDGSAICEHFEVYSNGTIPGDPETDETTLYCGYSRLWKAPDTTDWKICFSYNGQKRAAEVLAIFGADIKPRMILTFDGVEGGLF